MLGPQRDQARFELKKECLLHIAAALAEAAKTLPYGTTRQRLANQARRMKTCAITAYGRITSAPDEGTWLHANTFASTSACKGA